MEQELKQEGEPQEQVTEKPSEPVSEVTSPEEKKTSERTYSEAEWRKMQSMKDVAEAKALQHEKELQELRKKDLERTLADRRKELEALEGEPEEQAKIRRKHQLQDDLTALEEKKQKEEGAVLRKYDQALELAKEHSLSLEDARELMKAETPREMELIAQIKVAEREKISPPTPKEEKTGFKPDSGTSDAGADDDKAFLERWNAGTEPVTKESMARAQKIVNK